MATAIIETVPESVDFDGLYEVVGPRIEERPPMGVFEAVLAKSLLIALDAFASETGLGTAQIEVLFLLDRERNLRRRPDVAFLSRERWPIERPAPRAEAWDVVPDLAVEVISPTERAVRVVAKVRDYFRAGVRLVWVLYPVEGLAYVFDSAASARILTRDDALDGGDVLPGFALGLAGLFGEPEADPPAGGS